ncbi:MAG: FAD-binding domain-containing protein [Pseudomonadota bacterium]
MIDAQTVFEPTMPAALARLHGVDPVAYAGTRNALDGAVTGLSPYFTHGLLDLPAALAVIRQRHPLGPQDKLVMEFGWREFFAHVWGHQGEQIFSDLRPALAGVLYAGVLPQDIRTASTGVPVIDQAVRRLYSTGYLHNHARMWLASYVVHLRKVHWRVGADWLYAHLLDGDLASNHLSWQWVAGTFSVKPYLFNAENVARHAPRDWHSHHTLIDTSYEQLDLLARDAVDHGPEPSRPAPLVEPATLGAPPQPFAALPGTLPPAIRLVHPWSLGERADERFALGVIHQPFHQRFAWSARRWKFVTTRLQDCCDAVFVGDLATLLPQLQGSGVLARDTRNPGYHEALRHAPVTLEPVPRFLDDPAYCCQSFSKFYGLRGSAKWHS